MITVIEVIRMHLINNQFFRLAEELVISGHSRKNAYEMASGIIENMSKLLSEDIKNGEIYDFNG